MLLCSKSKSAAEQKMLLLNSSVIPQTPARAYQHNHSANAEQTRLGDQNPMLGGKFGKLCGIFGAHREDFAGIARSKSRGQIDKISNTHRPVVIQITFTPAHIRRAEIRSQGDEIRDRNAAVEVQVANRGRPDQQMRNATQSDAFEDRNSR